MPRTVRADAATAASLNSPFAQQLIHASSLSDRDRSGCDQVIIRRTLDFAFNSKKWSDHVAWPVLPVPKHSYAVCTVVVTGQGNPQSSLQIYDQTQVYTLWDEKDKLSKGVCDQSHDVSWASKPAFNCPRGCDKVQSVGSHSFLLVSSKHSSHAVQARRRFWRVQLAIVLKVQLKFRECAVQLI